MGAAGTWCFGVSEIRNSEVCDKAFFESAPVNGGRSTRVRLCSRVDAAQADNPTTH